MAHSVSVSHLHCPIDTTSMLCTKPLLKPVLTRMMWLHVSVDRVSGSSDCRYSQLDGGGGTGEGDV